MYVATTKLVASLVNMLLHVSTITKKKIEYYCDQFFSKTLYQRDYGDTIHPISDLGMVPSHIGNDVMEKKDASKA